MQGLVSLILYALFGMVIGTVLNVYIDRLPRRLSGHSLRPQCMECERDLSLLDLAPVLGYIASRGKCRHCQANIPLRMPIVQVGIAIAFGLLWILLGPGVKLVVASIYVCILAAIFIIDLEHSLILNKVIYPSLLLAPITSYLYGISLPSIVLGGVVGFGIYLLLYLVYPGGIKAGDVKLGALVGIISGFPQVLVGILAASIIGGVVLFLLLLVRVIKLKDYVPYGPFMVVGVVVALLWREAQSWPMFWP